MIVVVGAPLIAALSTALNVSLVEAPVRVSKPVVSENEKVLHDKTERLISCTFKDSITLEHILISLLEDSYTYSQHSLGGSVFSILGTYNEI